MSLRSDADESDEARRDTSAKVGCDVFESAPTGQDKNSKSAESVYSVKLPKACRTSAVLKVTRNLGSAASEGYGYILGKNS